MGHCVRIVLPVPSSCEAHKAWSLKAGKLNWEIVQRIARRWGGVTTWDSKGVWLDKNQVSVIDKTLIVECSIPEWNAQTREWWVALAALARKVHKQDCVFLSVREETALLIGHDADGITEDTIGA